MQRILLLVTFLSITYGDVMYEMVTKTEGMIGLGNGVTTARNFIKCDRLRIEINPEGPVLNNKPMVAITRFDKSVIWLLDTDKNEYVEIPFDENVDNKNYDIFGFTPEIKIEKLEETKEILKIKCEKYSISVAINSNNEKIQINQIVWMGKDFQGYNEIKELNKKIQGRIIGVGLLDVDDRLHRSLQKKISEIEGFPLEIEFYLKIEENDVKTELKSSSVVKKIVTVPISDKVFEIPQGYSPAKSPGTD